MDEIYYFLITKLNYDVVYNIKKEVDIYNNKCKFKYCLEQVIDIIEDYKIRILKYRYRYNFYLTEIEEFYKYILKKNRDKMELKKE
jgi:hypothetical protein